jgi:PHD/YefM family antitoxin component YafN of YafNO toxin-antitoxin module
MRYADEGAPVIVTRNGKDAAVILSMAKYERMLAAPEIATERALATAAAIFKQAAQRKAP